MKARVLSLMHARAPLPDQDPRMPSPPPGIPPVFATSHRMQQASASSPLRDAAALRPDRVVNQHIRHAEGLLYGTEIFRAPVPGQGDASIHPFPLLNAANRCDANPDTAGLESADARRLPPPDLVADPIHAVDLNTLEGQLAFVAAGGDLRSIAEANGYVPGGLEYEALLQEAREQACRAVEGGALWSDAATRYHLDEDRDDVLHLMMVAAKCFGVARVRAGESPNAVRAALGIERETLAHKKLVDAMLQSR